MDRLVRSVGRRLEGVTGMERFVRLVVGGGAGLVAGLWIASLAGAGSGLRLVGWALVLLGVGGLAAGIGSEIDWWGRGGSEDRGENGGLGER